MELNFSWIKIIVMEIANGEYGEMVNKLVVAVMNGKCNNWNQEVNQKPLPLATEETKVASYAGKCLEQTLILFN